MTQLTRRGRLWIPVDVNLLDPIGNKHGIDDVAIMAYERCLAWTKVHDTDGRVPLRAASRFLNGSTRELEAAELITIDDDSLVIPDWTKWHETSVQRSTRQARDRERKRRDYASNTSPTGKYRVGSPRGRRAESSVDDDATWNVTCRHGAPYNGRGCIECRTGKDIA